MFASFGATVAVLSTPKRHTFFRTVSVIGLTVSLAILVQSQRTNQVWALPTGNAALTFFPANAPFLHRSHDGGCHAVVVLGAFRFADRLSSLGRVSLTVYVLHFVPFALFHQAEALHDWSPALTAGVVLGYTVGWIVLGTLLAQRAPLHD